MQHGVPNVSNWCAVVAFVDATNNLPTLIAYWYNSISSGTEALASTISVVNEANNNLSESDKELLHWHCKLAHLSF